MNDSNNHFLPSESTKKVVPGLTVEYKVLGTITLDELFQAIRSDFQALKDLHDVQFVTGAKLRLPVTDGYGQRIQVRRGNGAPMHMMHTYHHKPACKDHEL